MPGALICVQNGTRRVGPWPYDLLARHSPHESGNPQDKGCEAFTLQGGLACLQLDLLVGSGSHSFEKV